MTDKEFKRLRRSDLIAILYEYQKREKALNEEIASLKAQLESRELKLSEAGSIAEATVKLNELFETAQKTADDYLAQVRQKYDKEIKDAAERQAEEIIRSAREKAAEITGKPDAAPAPDGSS